jgi:hypothetical protein
MTADRFSTAIAQNGVIRNDLVIGWYCVHVALSCRFWAGHIQISKHGHSVNSAGKGATIMHHFSSNFLIFSFTLVILSQTSAWLTTSILSATVRCFSSTS